MDSWHAGDEQRCSKSKMKVTAVTTLCNGCGMCAIVCPEVFRMDGQPKGNFAVVRSGTVPDPTSDVFRIAVECCGRGAIRTSMDSFADLGALKEETAMGKAAYRKDLGRSRRQQANAVRGRSQERRSAES